MHIPGWLLRHKVDVEPFTGDLSQDDSYSPMVVGVPCWRDEKTRLVRNSNGDEVVSSTQLITTLSRADLFPVDSRVTIGPDRVSYVLGVSRHDDGDLGAWQHLQVDLQ